MDIGKDTLARFDRLVNEGEILWQQTPPRHVSCEPFDFEFRVAKSLKKKPRNAGSTKRTPAFMDTNKDFDLGSFGTRHKLILNKYCVVRPQLVLHTIDFESQDDILNVDDFNAAWLALTSLGDKYMVIFNGGKDAGASLNHKHLQVLPRPGKGGLETLLYGSGKETEASSGLDSLPYQLAVRKLPGSLDGGSLEVVFQDLRKEVGLKPDQPYNMILLHQHMIVIPRRAAFIDGVDANAASMIGMAFCSSEEQYEDWVRRGPMEWLQDFGVPKKP